MSSYPFNYNCSTYLKKRLVAMVILVSLVITLHEPMCNQEPAHVRNQPSR